MFCQSSKIAFLLLPLLCSSLIIGKTQGKSVSTEQTIPRAPSHDSEFAAGNFLLNSKEQPKEKGDIIGGRPFPEPIPEAPGKYPNKEAKRIKMIESAADKVGPEAANHATEAGAHAEKKPTAVGGVDVAELANRMPVQEGTRKYLNLQVYPPETRGKVSGTIYIHGNGEQFNDIDIGPLGSVKVPFHYKTVPPSYLFEIAINVGIVKFVASKVYLDKVLTLNMENGTASQESFLSATLIQQLDLEAFKKKFAKLEANIANIAAVVDKKIVKTKEIFASNLGNFIKQINRRQNEHISAGFDAVKGALNSLRGVYEKGYRVLSGYEKKIDDAMGRIDGEANGVIAEEKKIQEKLGQMKDEQKILIGTAMNVHFMEELEKITYQRGDEIRMVNSKLNSAESKFVNLEGDQKREFGQLNKELDGIRANGEEVGKKLKSELANIDGLHGVVESANDRLGLIKRRLDAHRANVQTQLMHYIGSPKEAITVQVDGQPTVVAGKLNPILGFLLPLLPQSFIFPKIQPKKDALEADLDLLQESLVPTSPHKNSQHSSSNRAKRHIMP